MLDPFIIDEILRKERDERDSEQVQIQLEIEAPRYEDPEQDPAAETIRGVAIIEF